MSSRNDWRELLALLAAGSLLAAAAAIVFGWPRPEKRVRRRKTVASHTPAAVAIPAPAPAAATPAAAAAPAAAPEPAPALAAAPETAPTPEPTPARRRRRPSHTALRRLALAMLTAAVALFVAVPVAWQLERVRDDAGTLPDTTSEPNVAPPPVMPPDASPAPPPTASEATPAPPTPSKAEPAPATSPPPAIEPDARPTLRPSPAVHSGLINAQPMPVSASPVRLRIPAIDLNARIEPVGVDATTRAVSVPSSAHRVAWYEHSAVPSQPGSAVLTAHVDYAGERGAFFDLRRLRPGDRITVELDDGSREVFEVVARRRYERDQLPRQRIFSSSGSPVLTLVTCGGSFNQTERRYDSNIVVFAVPVELN